MAKKDDRPIDVGLAALTGSDEAAAIEFWKKRFELIAAIPSDVARVGAMTPQLRELTRMVNEVERERLTRARLIAFAQLSSDVQQKITASRKAAWDVDRSVLEKDQALVDKILPTVEASVRSAYPR
ncbi:MAG TPA: hypothetical protein DCK98_16805 [Chloroflexi bacterium]|jgi:nicotinic acid mononucleotide adenylyltransferase|nr:hypothetical protein [Chloroflexota bacterium]HAL26584.1 hypothetical protein [Chloroflexota bacterium]